MTVLEDSLETFRKEAARDPFHTWLLTDFPEEIRSAIKKSDAAVIGKQITSLSNFATTIVETAHPDQKILSKNEQFLLFSKFANESELVTDDIPLPLTTVNDIMEIYKYCRWDNVDLIPFSEKVGIIGSIIDAYQTWMEEHNCLDFITTVEVAISIIKHGSFPVNKIILALDKPTNKLMKKFSETLQILPHEEFRITPEKHHTSIKLVKYSSDKAEIEDILEQAATLLETGVNPKDILIISPSIPITESYMREICDTFYFTGADGTPQTLDYECTDAGCTLTQIPEILAAISALSSVATGYRLADLETVIASRYFTKLPTKKLTPGILHHIAAISGVTEDRNAWIDLKDRVHLVTKEKHHENTSGINRFAEETEELAYLIKWLENLNAGETYKERAQNYINWLAASGWNTAVAEEERPRKTFLSLLKTIVSSPAGSLPCTVSDFFYHIVHLANDKVLEVTSRNPNAIRLAGMRSSRPPAASHVFITGMNAESIPHIFSTLPPLEEEDTVILLPNLKTELYTYEKDCFTNACNVATEFLQISCTGSSGGKSKTPSSFLMNLGPIEDAGKRIQNHSILWNQKQAGAALTAEKSGELPPVGINTAENLSSRIEGENSGKIYNTDFSGSKEFSDIYTEDTVYSATMLESYLKCPYAWFLKNHLGLYNPYDESSEEAILGNVIHRTLDRFLREYHTEITGDTKEEARKQLFKTAKEEFERANVHTPSWEAKTRFYLAESPHTSPLDAFLEMELELEANGWKENKTEHGLKTTLENDTGTMNFYGEIDRIVENNQNQFQVIDYKAGFNFKYSSKKNIQVPLYAAAYQKETGKEPVNGYYLMMNGVAPKKTLSIAGELAGRKPLEETVTGALDLSFAAVENMRNGNCVPAEKCTLKSCKYRYICHKTDKDDQETEQ